MALPESDPGATVTIAEDAAGDSSAAVPDTAGTERYRRDRRLGVGGMGEVWRVYDRQLERYVVQKVVNVGTSAAARERFVTEARVTAGLQHPGIVPVHEVGVLPDGRPYYTMREITGTTLTSLIRRTHAELGPGEAPPLRRLIEAVRQAAEAVAYAHSVGVLHRDLKPENIMVGGFGEVLVVDWGLVRIARTGEDDPADDATRTRMGQVVGTPVYMPPEQARGDQDRIGPRSDVYGLGATLYEVLCGTAPYAGSVGEVLAAVRRGPPPPPSARSPHPIPEALEQICVAAMAHDPDDRLADPGALVDGLTAWLDGAQRRQEALELVERADALRPDIARLTSRAEALRDEAASLLDGVQPHDPVDQKRPAWRLEARAREVERERDLQRLAYVETLHGALTRAPELDEAHRRLADHYQAEEAAAELRGDAQAALTAAVRLKTHDRGTHARWLGRRGALTVHTEPPGASVRLRRFQERDRRLVLDTGRDLGTTPLDAVDVEAGSYLAELRLEGRLLVRLPVEVPRGGHADGVPPDGTAPASIWLPPREGWGRACYVPAGWARVGGDPDAPDSLPAARLWVDGFAMQRVPVTVQEWHTFLQHLARHGESLQGLLPDPTPAADGTMRPVLDVAPSGEVQLVDPSVARRPVSGVSWHAASRYAAWWSTRTGLAWRLPHELEWEKAARGVDGRFYPWGDHFEATWSCNMDAQPSTAVLSDVGGHPVDRSVYGLHDLAGNVRCWCANTYERRPRLFGRLHVSTERDGGEPRPLQLVRGGAFAVRANLCRSASRAVAYREHTLQSLGVRLVRSVERLT